MTPAADPTNLVPELNSIYYENIWVTIDLIRIYKADIRKYVPESSVQKLSNKIELNLKTLLYQDTDESIRSIQCKLLVLYEALSHYSHIEILGLCSLTEIDLKNRYIGKLIYADDVLSSYNATKTSITNFIQSPDQWKKRPLTSLLVSSSPGQGKSELAKQIGNEIEQFAKTIGKGYEYKYNAIGSNISEESDLKKVLHELESTPSSDNIRVIIFDEVDKANFDFFAPFLSYLESPLPATYPLTFYFFCQSKFSTFASLSNYAHTLENKSLRDFLTRMQLGHVDIPDLKFSPQQKVYTALGYAFSQFSELAYVSRDCLYMLAISDSQNNRDVIGKFSKEVQLIENEKLALKKDVLVPGDLSQLSKWIKLNK
ncbi:MAG: hypothetical protein EOO43_11330 [Flavobacterium sp.]|nr:MAG: hypothetical protein EOO43_11330 [Flavobacterium sp.]